MKQGIQLSLLGGLALCVSSAFAASSEQDALHAINRLSFGPAPGDLAHVKAIGVDAYIDAQLHPERIPTPLALRNRLASLDALSMSQGNLVRSYHASNKASREAKNEGEAKNTPEREKLRQVIAQGMEARIFSAIYSPRQLEEVMSDFWYNHFNVQQSKGIDRVLVANYEHEAIRPHVFGRFRDLLGATAKHPAMLFYLDNWLSTTPGYKARGGNGPRGKSAGLNENYAREIMELHTLGVDGGYSQKDVTELARIFTGWTINYRGNSTSLFSFEPAMHDKGEKLWLGHHVKENGQNEAEWAMDQLARHSATARFISFKLAQYFVSDQPPTALVDRMAKEFLRNDGEIRSVLALLFASPEFRNPANIGVKFKTPYQYIISIARAVDEPIANVRPLLASLNQLGMPLYGCPTPDGYKNTEAAWLNAEGISRRVSFATAYASGRLPLAQADDGANANGVRSKALERLSERMDAERFKPAAAIKPADTAALLAALGSSISDKTRNTVSAAQTNLQSALVLGSPDFMKK